jgi:SAM-dependent methyltransferase
MLNYKKYIYFKNLINQYDSNYGEKSYFEVHKNRYINIAKYFSKFLHNKNLFNSALEIGATDIFQVSLYNIWKFNNVYGTVFDRNNIYQEKYIDYTFSKYKVNLCAFNIDIEREKIPLPDGKIDFILCADVIEHMEIDPMFMMYEFNRIIAKDGLLLITTPNAASARIFWSIFNNYRPHFFMQYNKKAEYDKHNFEYDTTCIRKIVTSAGFSIINLNTIDVYDEPCTVGYDLLKKIGAPSEDRGDCIFCIAQKISEPIERYPEYIYA